MRQLPPLAALRAFEAAARHLSFKRAAGELHVTPTAISHQVKLLEETVGTRLFERRTRQVILTPEGQRLYPVLRDGLDAFASAIADLALQKRRASVTISATRAFTAKWLVPRMAGFQRQWPEIDLRVLATEEAVDMEAAGVDLSIRFARGPFPGHHAEFLGVDRFAPVAHPSLGLAEPADLLRLPLIHFEFHRYVPDDPYWPRWFREAGMDPADARHSLHFTEDSHAIQATLAGQGVGLLSLPLVADDLASGILVQPFGPELEGIPFYLLQPTARPTSDAVAAVREWVLAEIGRAGSAGGG